MADFSQLDIALLTFMLGLLVGFLGVVVWKSRDKAPRGRRRARARHSVSCLMCGRPNPVGPEERESCRLVCRCGQPLYLARLSQHPHPRPH
jgi:hypothetical protein